MPDKLQVHNLWSTTLYDPGDVNLHARAHMDDVFTPPVKAPMSKAMKADLAKLRKLRKHQD